MDALAWSLAINGLLALLTFINIIMWRDDIACRNWYKDDLEWERAEHAETLLELNAAIDSHTDLEMELAFALEQLYAKATLQEAMDHACIIVVSDVDLQALAADKGPDASFTFDRLVTSALDDEDEDE